MVKPDKGNTKSEEFHTICYFIFDLGIDLVGYKISIGGGGSAGIRRISFLFSLIHLISLLSVNISESEVFPKRAWIYGAAWCSSVWNQLLASLFG